MRLTAKISAAVVLLMLIPIIIYSLDSAVRWKKNNYRTAREHSMRHVRSEAAFLNSKFGDILSDIKRCSENRKVTDYAVKAADYSESLRSGEEYSAVKEIFEEYISYGDVYAVEMTNTAGTVIYSNIEGAEGNPSENCISEETNEVFPLGMFENSPIFRAESKVYTSDNQIAGNLCFIYKIDVITNTAEIMTQEKEQKILLVDKGNRLLEAPYKVVRDFEWNNEYKMFSEWVKSYRAPADKDQAQEFFDYYYDKDDKSVYVGYAQNCGWYVIGISNLSKYHRENGQNMLYIWLIVLAVTVLSVVAVRFFTAPADKFIKFLEERKKGNNSAELVCNRKDEFGDITYLFNTLIDELTDSELRYRTIAEMTDNIVFDINLSKSTVIVSNNFDKKFSFRPKDNSLDESFLYKSYVYKEDKSRFTADFSKIMTVEDKWRGEYRMKNLYGDFTWIRIQAKKLRNRSDIPTRIVGVILDINREKESELHLIQKATLDALTQLNNRESFLKKLGAETAQITSKDSLTAVMFIDLDDFKFFNDEYTHECGDEVLKFTADTIKELCFGRGFGGRFGGDEFVVCLTGLKLIGDAGKAAEELITVLSGGFDSPSANVHLSIGCSVGIAFHGENGSNPNEIIAAADAAMYKIKKHGKSNYTYASANENSAQGREFSPIESDNEPSDSGENTESTESEES